MDFVSFIDVGRWWSSLLPDRRSIGVLRPTFKVVIVCVLCIFIIVLFYCRLEHVLKSA